MRKFRAHASVTFVCLAVVLCLAVSAAVLIAPDAALVSVWLLVILTTAMMIRHTDPRCDEQLGALLSLTPSRGPPPPTLS